MRVISQNGTLDFPYDQIVVEFNGSNIVCKPVSNMSGRYYTIGIYSTEENAKKAMEMLRDTYERVWDIECGNRDATKHDTCSFVFPQDGEVNV